MREFDKLKVQASKSKAYVNIITHKDGNKLGKRKMDIRLAIIMGTFR